MSKIYCLSYLNDNLRKSGILQKCFKYDISGDGSCMRISYLDYLLSEQFIFVFRTSRLSYRIFYKGDLLSARTSKAATDLLISKLDETISENKYYETITVAELCRMTAKPNHSDSLKLYLRLKEQKKKEP